MELVLAAIFLLLIPVNIGAARDIDRYARVEPRLGILVLLARLVTVLAIVACVFGLLSVAQVFRLLTGNVLIPPPVSAAIFVTMGLIASAANLLVRRYLRSKRAPTSGGDA
jgi:hypothetical protein